jgi:hypothetical protein
MWPEPDEPAWRGADSMGPPGYRSVMRWLTNGLRHPGGVALPTSSALTKARQRLGAKPLELLFDLRRWPRRAHRARSRSACGWWPGTEPASTRPIRRLTPRRSAEFKAAARSYGCWP